jgi:hypothetical protein
MSGTGLLTYASPWQNESNNRSNNTVRKRQSTLPTPCMRNNKTIKKNPATLPNIEDADEYPVDRENFQSLTPATLDDDKSRSTKIQEIINNVGSIKTEDDGTALANFNPNTNYEKRTTKPIAPFYATNDSTSYPLGNYKDIYNSPSHIGDYPYSKPSTVNSSAVPLINDKFTEKINYMIHLLEEQQKEPTKHITEEFILYTFLGIFVIYIVDSFARVGKYIR